MTAWSFIFRRTAAYLTCFREVRNIGVIVSEWFKTKNSSRRQHAFLSSNTSDSKRMHPPNSLPITSASDPLEAPAPALQGNLLSVLSSDPPRLHVDCQVPSLLRNYGRVRFLSYATPEGQSCGEGNNLRLLRWATVIMINPGSAFQKTPPQESASLLWPPFIKSCPFIKSLAPKKYEQKETKRNTSKLPF